MAEQSKKRPRLPDNTESSPSKKTSILELSSPVATMAPAPARASPSPVAARTPSLAAPSPLSKRTPSLAAPSPAARSKPIAVVKPAAATVVVTNPVPAMAPPPVATSPVHASPLVAVTDPVPAMAPALVETCLVATSTPASALPSPAASTEPAVLPAPNTVATRTLAMAAPGPVATAKPTTTVKDESEYGVLESDEQAAVVPAVAEEAVILEVKKKWLHCVTCYAPLKPRIFMCDGGHTVCCDCAGGGENKHCGACNRAATYTHIPCMDGLVGSYKVPCPYKVFGCSRSTAYHAAADHKARCAHAPCYCLECPFEGSPASLLLHLTDQSGRHRWPVETIKYQTRHRFVVPASEHRRLLVAEEDGRVFLLAVGAGRGASGVRPVNVVCVRGNAGGADARPLYTGVLWVDGPLAAAGHLRGGFQQKGDVASCGLPGEVDMAHGQLHAHVNPEMLHGESKEVHLGICITKFW